MKYLIKILKTANNAKSSEEAVEVANEIEKIIKSNRCSILCFAYLQGQIFERSNRMISL